MNRNHAKPRRTLFFFWLTIWFAYGFVHQRSADNAMVFSRLDLLHSLVLQKTFAIDAYQENTFDKAFFGGHYYCDKAPGTVFLALPAFFLASKGLGGCGVPLDSERGWFWSDWISTAASVGALTAAGMVCLFLWLQGLMPPRKALLATLVAAFGSAAFPYSTMLLAHGVVVGLFCMALWWLRLGHDCPEWDGGVGEADRIVRPSMGPGQSEGEGRRAGGWREVAAGAACGLAVACEYDAALMAGGVLVAACFSSFRRAGCLVLGAIPMVSLIPIYNWICLGTPFSLPYGHEAVFTQMHTGFYGVYLPNLANFFDLLLRPERGLFLWTPFLLLSFFGYARLRARSRSLFWLCCLVPILHLVLMSGYYTTLAGSTLGARFLAPLLPLLILPAGTGASRAPRFALVSAFWSVAAMGGATLVEARLPNQLDNPLWQFYLPEFLAGHFTHNLGQAIGLRGWWSMAPMLLVVCGGIWHVWRSLGKNDSTIERPQTQGKAAHEKDVGKAKNESF